MTSRLAKKIKTNSTLKVENVDRGGHPLRPGDRVGFVMRGWYLPRGQESFGTIESIDDRGGISIKAMESYRVFTSTGRVASKESYVYFVHHLYDSKLKRRIYSITEGTHALFLYRIDVDEVPPAAAG
jgi:hypothetical protein